jgi:beta-glucosidase
MARYLHDHGVSSNDLSFFREKRAVGQRWLGVDYYQTCEHHVEGPGRVRMSDNPMGFRRLVSQYHHRYGLPIFHCETNRVSEHAVGWLEEQWQDVIALRSAGIPMTGFTWYSLTDQIDWQHCLREERNDLHPVGLYDLDRRIRPVGRRYQEIVQLWTPALAGVRESAPLAGRQQRLG